MQHSTCPTIHPTQCAKRALPFSSVIIYNATQGSFILFECLTFPRTMHLFPILCPFTQLTKPETSWLYAVTPKSFDPCRRSLSKALEMTAGNPWIRPVANSLNHTLWLEFEWRNLFIETFLHVGIKVVRIIAQGICRHLDKYGTPTWRLKFPAKFVTPCENALYKP